jgi:MoaA/NifB/PqqE/SkfB family radical SAM enzyme
MHEVRALGIFVGTGECNAHCPHCAGVPLRKDAPIEDNFHLMHETIKSCYERGARSLTLTSSGEPTLSPLAVTQVLEIVKELNISFDTINLYTNGIKIGEDEKFCNEYLLRWKRLGLTTFHMTVHDTNSEKNARLYGVASYPPLETVVSRMKKAELAVRANIVLTQGNCNILRLTAQYLMLKSLGFDGISVWPVRDPLTDEIDASKAPTKEQTDDLEVFHSAYQEFGIPVQFYSEKHHQEVSLRGEKLTLFQNGTLANSWCK